MGNHTAYRRVPWRSLAQNQGTARQGFFSHVPGDSDGALRGDVNDSKINNSDYSSSLVPELKT